MHSDPIKIIFSAILFVYLKRSNKLLGLTIYRIEDSTVSVTEYAQNAFLLTKWHLLVSRVVEMFFHIYTADAMLPILVKPEEKVGTRLESYGVVLMMLSV